MGYRLTVVFGGKTIERKEVNEGRLIIGRSPDCDLVIDNLGVSRQHAEIENDNNVPVVRDLKSNNGTFVNGRRISKHNLNDGDEIAIGKFTLTFQAELDPEAEDEEAEATPKPASKSGEYTLAIDSRVMDQRQRERSSKLKAYILVGDGARQRTIVLDRSVFTFGKAPTCDYQVGGWFTARKHCIVFRDELSFRLIDTSQKGRTYLNETSIDDERLKDGDVIRIGRNRIQFMVGIPPV